MPDIRLPNGYVIKGVPDGVSKQEVMERAIAKGYATAEDFPEMATPVSAAQPPAPSPSSPAGEQPSIFQRYLSTMRAIPETVSTAVQNVATLGQAPKIQAFEAAALGPETYEQALAREEAERARVKEASPVLYGATQAAAPLALAPLTGGATLPFTGGRFVAQGLAIPAAEGALLGATQSAEEGQSMAQGATLGGAMGGLLGPVGYGIGALASNIGGRLFGNSKAEQIVKDSIAEDLTPEGAMQRLKAGGDEYMIADLVPEATYAVQAQPGPARQQIRQALETRQKGDLITGEGGQKAQFRDIMNDFTGRYDENFYGNLRKLREEKSEVSRAAYEKAFEDTIEPTEQMIKVVNTPLGQQAYSNARKSWQNEMMTPDFPYATPDDITDLKFWNNFKKELDQLADYTPAGQRIFKKADRSPDNVNASRMAGAVREDLKRQSDNYADALQANRNFQQMDEGMRLGKDIYRMNMDEIEDKMANLTVPKDAVKMGVIQAVKEQVQNMMDSGSVGRKVTRNDKFKSVLKQIIPEKKEYAKFLGQIQRLEDQAYTYGRVTRTVPTAENIAAIQRAEQQPSMLGDIAELNIGQGIRRAAGQVGRQTLPREQIADILLQQGPQAMQTLQRMYGPQSQFGLPGMFGFGASGLGTQAMFQQ